MNYSFERPRFTSPLILATCVLGLLFITAGCLSQGGETEFRTTVQVGMELNNVDTGEHIVAGDDSILIDQVKLMHGASYFRTEDDDTLYLHNNPQVPLVEQVGSQTDNPIVLDAGNLVQGKYEVLNIKFPRAPEDTPVQDPDFTNGGRYSLIIKGSYNGQQFTYRSTRSYETMRTFSPVLDVPEFNVGYVFIIRADAADWFRSQSDGTILNPKTSENRALINDNIASSFQITILQGSGQEI